jgi:hypothetical protein
MILLVGVLPMNMMSALNEKWLFGGIGLIKNSLLIK